MSKLMIAGLTLTLALAHVSPAVSAESNRALSGEGTKISCPYEQPTLKKHVEHPVFEPGKQHVNDITQIVWNRDGTCTEHALMSMATLRQADNGQWELIESHMGPPGEITISVDQIRAQQMLEDMQKNGAHLEFVHSYTGQEAGLSAQFCSIMKGKQTTCSSN